MSTTLSLRIDEDTKEGLEALAKRSRRSKSLLAAEAVASYVEAESWQLDETAAGLDDLEQGRTVEHEGVAEWLIGVDAFRSTRLRSLFRSPTPRAACGERTFPAKQAL